MAHSVPCQIRAAPACSHVSRLGHPFGPPDVLKIMFAVAAAVNHGVTVQVGAPYGEGLTTVATNVLTHGRLFLGRPSQPFERLANP